MSIVRAWLLNVLVALSGCVIQSYPPLSCPGRGGPPWTEALTPHVRLRTDLPVAQVSAFAVEAEHAVDELEQVIRAEFGLDALPMERLQLTVFRRQEDMTALDGFGGESGRFHRVQRPWEQTPAIEMTGGFDERGRHRLRHELTHWLLSRYLPTVPHWLDEGLAELYSTMRRDGDHAVVGSWSAELHRRGYQPDVGEVFSTRYAPIERVAFYMESLALVHLLKSERHGYRTRFLRFIDALHRGVRWDLAWRESFGALGLGVLEGDLNGYAFIAMRLDTWRVPLQPPLAVAPALHPLSDGEVHLLWLALRHRGDAARHAQARHDLAEAAARGGNATELVLWRAALAREDGRRAEAIAALRSALDAAPDDPRLLYADRVLVEDPSIGERLSRAARSSDELVTAANDLAAHRPSEAVTLAHRAVALDPANTDAWASLAGAMRSRGDLDGARRAAQRAAWLEPSRGDLLLTARELDAQARAAGAPALPSPFEVLASPRFDSPRGLRVSGRVLADGDRPVAGTAQLASGTDYVVTRLDEHGAFEGCVPPGDVELTVIPDARDLLADQFHYTVKPSSKPVELGVRRVATAPAVPTAYDGLEATNRDGRILVDSVQEGSPADAAGVRRGDVLLSIDGRSVAGFGRQGVNALLRGAPDADKTLVVQSGQQQPRTVRFPLAPIPAP